MYPTPRRVARKSSGTPREPRVLRKPLGVNSSGVLLVADILTLIALGAGFLDYRRKAAFYHGA